MSTNRAYTNYTYDYQKPHNTWTLDQFIASQNDSVMSYHNLSFVDIHDGIAYDTYNVLTDYIDEIRSEYCVPVKLNMDQLEKYKYRPKLLCFDMYGNGELAFILLLANDMCSVKSFTKDTILMPRVTMMNELVKYLSNANRMALRTYNKKEKT